MRYLYSKAEKFCVMEFFGSDVIPNEFIEVSDEDYKKLCNHELCWKDGKLTKYEKTAADEREEERAKKLTRIAELKRLLSDSDYKALKFAEGYISTEDYAETKLARQSWRNEINDLENQIGGDV